MEGTGRGGTHVSGVVGHQPRGRHFPSPSSCGVQPRCFLLATPRLQHQHLPSQRCSGAGEVVTHLSQGWKAGVPTPQMPPPGPIQGSSSPSRAPSQARITSLLGCCGHFLSTPVSQLVPSVLAACARAASKHSFLHTGLLPPVPSGAPSPFPPTALLRQPCRWVCGRFLTRPLSPPATGLSPSLGPDRCRVGGPLPRGKSRNPSQFSC